MVEIHGCVTRWFLRSLRDQDDSVRAEKDIAAMAMATMISTRWSVGRSKSTSSSATPTVRVRAAGGPLGLSEELRGAIDKFIAQHKVVLFMKGTKSFPQCGFSNTCVQILNTLNVQYETVNILEDESLRQGMKEYSSWPTFPQCYIDGEFYGGCDIMIEGYQSGELQETIEKAMVS